MTMTGPSVYLVRLPDTMVLRNVGAAIAVLVGCFGDADVCGVTGECLRGFNVA